jgi:hypothetical protein
MRTLLFAVLLMALLSMQAVAEFKTGRELQQDSIQCDDGKGDMYFCGKLQGFITGVFDTSSEYATVTDCSPVDLSPMDLRLTVEMYLNDNPAKLDDAASNLVRTAINEAWPCPE